MVSASFSCFPCLLKYQLTMITIRYIPAYVHAIPFRTTPRQPHPPVPNQNSTFTSPALHSSSPLSASCRLSPLTPFLAARLPRAFSAKRTHTLRVTPFAATLTKTHRGGTPLRLSPPWHSHSWLCSRSDVHRTFSAIPVPIATYQFASISPVHSSPVSNPTQNGKPSSAPSANITPLRLRLRPRPTTATSTTGISPRLAPHRAA